MQDAQGCLAAWRQAERLRDATPQDTTDWADAQQEVRQARLVYRATVARTAASYAGSADPPLSSRWATLGTLRHEPVR